MPKAKANPQAHPDFQVSAGEGGEGVCTQLSRVTISGAPEKERKLLNAKPLAQTRAETEKRVRRRPSLRPPLLFRRPGASTVSL